MIASRALRLLFAGIASLGLVAACGGSDDDSFDDRADAADPKVRFVHAVPGAPNVTLQRNGTEESGARDVAYKYASQYYDVDTEDYTFKLVTADGSVELDEIALETDRGNRYTLVALPTDTGVGLLSFWDPYDKSLTSDDARLRVLHAAANAPAVDVYITATDADLANESADIADLSYKEVQPDSGSNSVELEQGTYRLRLTPAGSKSAVFDATVEVPENADWLLVALPDDAAPGSVRLLLVRSDDSDDATDEIESD